MEQHPQLKLDCIQSFHTWTFLSWKPAIYFTEWGVVLLKEICKIYFWFKGNLHRSTMYPKFDPTGVRTYGFQIMTAHSMFLRLTFFNKLPIRDFKFYTEKIKFGKCSFCCQIVCLFQCFLLWGLDPWNRPNNETLFTLLPLWPIFMNETSGEISRSRDLSAMFSPAPLPWFVYSNLLQNVSRPFINPTHLTWHGYFMHVVRADIRTSHAS